MADIKLMINYFFTQSANKYWQSNALLIALTERDREIIVAEYR